MSLILLADDDSSIVNVLTTALRRQGHDVITASSCAECLAALNHSSVDLLVTDLHMPGDSAPDFVRQLQNHFSRTPTVLISGDASAAQWLAAAGLGSVPLLLKPFPLVPFLAAVNTALLRQKPTD